MTHEEKQLLLKDLCARLPYGICGQFDVPSEKSKFERVLVVGDMCGIFSGDCLFKPYLHPMSSMTEEEKRELLNFGGVCHDGNDNVVDVGCTGFNSHAEVEDWLNAHHFDYRGLIEKGLALKAPEGMYKMIGMTQEEKEILLKELSARAFYGVKAHYEHYDFVGGSERFIYEADGTVKSVDISLGNPVYINFIHTQVEHTKPYLRPMSSMTEEERQEIRDKFFANSDNYDSALTGAIYTESQPYDSVYTLTLSGLSKYFDWLNAHHFDYRGLIGMGLALEAPSDMYKND